MLIDIPLFMSGPVALLAAGDWIGIVIAIIVFVISAIHQLMSAQKEKPGRPGKPQQPQRRPPGVPPRPEAQGAGRQELNTEIEEFLKRAAEQRRRPQSQVPSGARPPRPGPEVQPVRPRRLVETPVEASIAEIPTLQESVEQHVKTHISTDEFERRADHLGDDVERTGVEMQAHLKKVFSHQVGRLAVQQADGGEVQGTTVMAVSPILLLANSQTLRSAIILVEILRRPEDRW